MSPQANLVAKLRAHDAAVRAATEQTALLLAALHHSRALALTWGLKPWLRQLETRRQADARAAAHYAARLAAAAWRGLLTARDERRAAAAAAEASALASALCHREMYMLRDAFAALAALAAHGRAVRLRAQLVVLRRALRRWQGATAATLEVERSQLALAHEHWARQTTRASLAAFQLGTRRSKQERLVAARAEARWASVQDFLRQHRASRAGSREDSSNIVAATVAAGG